MSRGHARDRGSESFTLGVGRVVGSSLKALRVKFDETSLLGAREEWIPRSALHDDSEVFDAFNNARGNVVVEAWLARERGWETE